MNGVQLGKLVEKALNSYGYDTVIEQFIDVMHCSHRTIQQCFTKLCVEWFRHLASMYGQGLYDDRNLASCQLAKEVIELGEGRLALPFI